MEKSLSVSNFHQRRHEIGITYVRAGVAVAGRLIAGVTDVGLALIDAGGVRLALTTDYDMAEK